MTRIAPGWYKDPADPATQRYWDGEGWIGKALPADATPPPGPPEEPAGKPPAPEPASKPPAAELSARVAERVPGASRPAETARPSPGQQTPPGWSYPGLPVPGEQYPAGQVPPGRQYPPGLGMPPYQQGLPPPMPHGLPLATPGARLVARLIDFAVITGLALLANGWFLYQLGLEFGTLWQQINSSATVPAEDTAANRVNMLVFLIATVSAAIWLAYEVPAIANTGQTLGKRLLGIKVVRIEATGRLGFGRALGRWTTLGLPTLLWPCCGAGLLLQFLDCLFVVTDRPLNQALHDKRARTVVVHIGRTPTGSTPPSKPDGGTS